LILVKYGARSDRKSYESSDSCGRERVLVIDAKYGPRVWRRSGRGWA